ncbi:hypothetical protein C8R47DRAFT_1327811 [Mycena vitilis]|nr:hypothetical protein C8R47DRAFT_1327811 [Mycena vitilis]
MSFSTLASTEAATLDNTLGAVFFGVVFSSILFGVGSLQVYYYYHYYPHDTLMHKCSVGLLWFLDALHLSLTIIGTYHYGVRGFGHPEVLGEVIWCVLFPLPLPIPIPIPAFFSSPSLTAPDSLPALSRSIKLQAAINVVIILMVQSLYAYRVWLLSGYHHGVLGYLVAGVVLGGFAIGIVLAYETYTIFSWSQIGDIGWAVSSSFAASSFIDIVISVAMCYYLRKSKGRESRLNSRISTLMQWTLSSGIFTSACSVSALFSFITMPNNLVFLALSYLLTRLYVNSFMAMMNARQREHRHDDSTFSRPSVAPSNQYANPYGAGAGAGAGPRRMASGRSARDLEAHPHSSTDKYEWDAHAEIDIGAPAPALNKGGAAPYIPHMHGPALYDPGAVHSSYARDW